MAFMVEEAASVTSRPDDQIKYTDSYAIRRMTTLLSQRDIVKIIHHKSMPSILSFCSWQMPTLSIGDCPSEMEPPINRYPVIYLAPF